MPIAEILKSIRHKYSDDSIYTFNNFPITEITEADIIPTGVLDIDFKSGIGGIPKRRVTEIFGPESSCKTTLASLIVAQAQKQDILCAYIDTEQAIDFEWSRTLGVDPEKLIISQPETAEMAFGITEELINSKEVSLIVFDSLVGVGSTKEFEDKLGAANYGSTKLYYQWFRRNLIGIRENNVAMIFTNQIRDVIGAYVPMLDTPGGHALKLSSSMRLQMARIKDIKDHDEIIGTEFKATFKKNKLAPPSKVANFSLYFDKGFWPEADLLDNSLNHGIIEGAGPYYRYNGETLAQGKLNTIKYLEDNPKFALEIRKKLLNG